MSGGTPRPGPGRHALRRVRLFTAPGGGVEWPSLCFSREMGFGLSSPAHRAHVRRGVLTVGLVWAGAWGWFAVASAVSEGLAAFAFAILFLSVPVIVLVAIRRSPRVGGFAAVLAALVGVFFFQHWAAWAFLSAPALLLGVASISSAEPAAPRDELEPGAR